jgi:hypothetical protein
MALWAIEAFTHVGVAPVAAAASPAGPSTADNDDGFDVDPGQINAILDNAGTLTSSFAAFASPATLDAPRVYDVSALALLASSETGVDAAVVVGDADGQLTFYSAPAALRAQQSKMRYRLMSRSHLADDDSPRSANSGGPSSGTATAAAAAAVAAMTTVHDADSAFDAFLSAGGAGGGGGVFSMSLGAMGRAALGGDSGAGGAAGAIPVTTSFGRTALSSPTPAAAEPPRRNLRGRLTFAAFTAELDRARYPPRHQMSEKVLNIAPVAPQMSPYAALVLASNDLLVKLFSVRTYRNGVLAETAQPLTGPTLLPLRTFVSTHRTAIAALSPFADGETFLTADCFKLLWWSIEAGPQGGAGGGGTGAGGGAGGGGGAAPVTLHDMSPEIGEDVTEVATSAAAHPTHASLFLVTTSSGTVHVGDLRDSPSRARRFACSLTPDAGFTSRWVADPHIGRALRCSHGAVFIDDHHIVARDYMSLALWDMRAAGGGGGGSAATSASSAAASALVSRKSVGLESLAPSLSALFANERIFDRFPLACAAGAVAAAPRAFSPSGRALASAVATGLYGHSVLLWPDPVRDTAPLVLYTHERETGTARCVEGGDAVAWQAPDSIAHDPTSSAQRVTHVSLTPSELVFASATKVVRLAR